MPNVMIPDAGDGDRAGGSVPLTVSPDRLRLTAQGMTEVANDLEGGAGLKLGNMHVQPCGLDEVSVGAAERFNHQISGGPGSGLFAIGEAVANLRASAAAMTEAAQQYEAQNQATADALRANEA